MAEPSKDNDQSMEDILQSIKRIIADEGEPTPSMPGSDVLELTELLAEDAAPPAAPEPEPTPAPAPEKPRTAQDDIDALFAAAPAAPEPEPAPAPEPEPEPVIVPPPAPVVVAPAPAPAAAPAPVPQPRTADQLISDSTLAASIAALGALTNRQEHHHGDSPVFRSGSTVEDLVIEALKPMLKDWLDGNLPALVRSLVEREIRRVTGH